MTEQGITGNDNINYYILSKEDRGYVVYGTNA